MLTSDETKFDSVVTCARPGRGRPARPAAGAHPRGGRAQRRRARERAHRAARRLRHDRAAGPRHARAAWPGEEGPRRCHAAEFVEPGTAVAVTAGTTTHALAHYLARVPELTVVTNSLPVAEVLDASGRPDQTVVLSGGIRTPSDALVGPVAVRAIRSLHVDWAFMGVHGIHPDAGFTSPNLLEAETNRAVLASARRLVVLADHTKWEVVGLSTIASLE